MYLRVLISFSFFFFIVSANFFELQTNVNLFSFSLYYNLFLVLSLDNNVFIII